MLMWCINLILHKYYSDIPCSSYAMHRIGDFESPVLPPPPNQIKHLGHNWGLDSYFLTSNTYYPILTTFLDIRKAFNMEVIWSASQITSSRPTI